MLRRERLKQSTRMQTYKIRLTALQAGWAKYAIEQVSALEWEANEQPPHLDDRTLVFPEPSEQVVLVFLDALENQLSDECQADGVTYPAPDMSQIGRAHV